VAVYVDLLMPCMPNARWRYLWSCHMFVRPGPGALGKLHAFAARLGLKRAWFQPSPGNLPHYDLTPAKRRGAVAAGAVEVGREDLVDALWAWRAMAGRFKKKAGGA
jgi:hypothetical protein